MLQDVLQDVQGRAREIIERWKSISYTTDEQEC